MATGGSDTERGGGGERATGGSVIGRGGGGERATGDSTLGSDIGKPWALWTALDFDSRQFSRLASLRAGR